MVKRINEVYPNPTVQKVIFQARFSHLFYIENRIGEFQTKIMEIFPDPKIAYRNQFIIFEKEGKLEPEDIEKRVDEDFTKKVWAFHSDTGMELNVTSNSISIISRLHKTYNNPGGEKFRDIIQEVMSKFIEIIPLTVFKRISLRYIDKCPVPEGELTDAKFKEWYNTTFDLKQFSMTNVKEIATVSTITHEECYVKFIERMRINDKYRYELDFDGYAENIKTENYLSVTDKLHDFISSLYCDIIKEPVIEYMKTPKEE